MGVLAYMFAALALIISKASWARGLVLGAGFTLFTFHGMFASHWNLKSFESRLVQDV